MWRRPRAPHDEGLFRASTCPELMPMPNTHYVKYKWYASLTVVVGIRLFAAVGCADEKEKSRKDGFTDLDRLLEAGPAAAPATAVDAGDAGPSRPGWVRCQGGCSAKSGVPFQCEQATCTGDCGGECAGDSPVLCDGACEGTCNGMPSAGEVCKGSCTGKCKRMAPGMTCPGLCTGECSGVCVQRAGDVICNGECTGPSKPL